MEKWLYRISSFITLCIMYVIAGYLYLSLKGFAYQNGSFELVPEAKAGLLDFINNSKQADNEPVFLPRNVALNFPNITVAGNNNAPLSIFEFSSLGCTHCADFHLNGLRKLEKDFIEPGKVRIVFIHFPLDRRSMQAAMLAECVDADKRPEFLNLVFSKQREWGLTPEPEKYLINYAMMQGLSQAAAQKCLKNDDLAKEIISNRQEAIDKLKIEGTPAFLISTKDSNEIVYGFSDIFDFKARLKERLAEE